MRPEQEWRESGPNSKLRGASHAKEGRKAASGRPLQQGRAGIAGVTSSGHASFVTTPCCVRGSPNPGNVRGIVSEEPAAWKSARWGL